MKMIIAIKAAAAGSRPMTALMAKIALWGWTGARLAWLAAM
jgi:hypothetical protein